MITRERLEELAHFRGAPVTRQEEQEMARRVLTAEAQESVGVVRHVDLGGRTGVHVSLYVNNLPEGAELYAAPQPVAVPDAFIRDERGRMMRNGEIEPRIGYGAGWNACRAAMLAPVNPEFTTQLVGEVVAWHHPNHERNVDFRWLDFNVEPGTKLYAIKQERS